MHTFSNTNFDSNGNGTVGSCSEEWRRLASSIRLTPEQRDKFLKWAPVLFQLRVAIMQNFGPDVVEDLFGNLVPPVAMYPAVMPDSFALAHPATFDEREIIDHIKLLSGPGEVVLDAMVGSGTSVIAAYKMGRIGAGIELMEQWYELAKRRIAAITGSPYEDGKNNMFLRHGDCREVMAGMRPESIDLGVFSPPYWDILKNATGSRARYRQRQGLPANYGNSDQDLGRIDNYSDFLVQMAIIYRLYFNVLKKGRFLVSIVADIFKNWEYIPYHMDTIMVARAVGFHLKGIQVVLDHWKLKYVYGAPKTLFGNFHHHYALVFQKV